MCNFICDGISFSFGILFVELNSYFNASKGKTAWAGSLFLSIPLLTGPLASSLADHYGCRKVTIVSGLISAFGFILGYFAYTLEHLFIAFSIAGIGLSLCVVTSIVIVAYYFEKRRSLATGLAVCGTGVGTFLMPPLTIFLLEELTWRGTLLILAGIFLNIVVFGGLMRDIDIYDDESSDYESDSDSRSLNHHHARTVSESERNPVTLEEENLISPSSDNHPYQSYSLIDIPTYITRSSFSAAPELLNEISLKKGGHLTQLMQRYPNLVTSFLARDEKVEVGPAAAKPLLQNGHENLSRKPTGDIKSREPLVRSPSKKQSYVSTSHGRQNSLLPIEPSAFFLRHLKLQRGSITYRSAMLNLRKYKLRASSAPDIYRNSMVTIDSREQSSNLMHDFKDVLTDIVDISIFKSFRYTLFCISNLLLYACLDVPYVYLPDLAITVGVSDKETASLLISIVGIVNTLGVVIVGYIGDKTWIRAPTLYSLSISISGISMALIPIMKTYTGLAILAGVYGLTISANYALVSVILVDLISLDKFTNGYGILLLMQGIASLLGPPFAGWLFDVTGNYDATFYATGACIFISGAIVLPTAEKVSITAEVSEPSSRPSSPESGKPNHI